MPIGVSSAFFVLNPEGDLKKTEQRFQGYFQSQGETALKGKSKSKAKKGPSGDGIEWKCAWSGIAGRKPTKEEYEVALQQNQLFVYMGHSAGEQFLSMEQLHKLRVKSAVILMGCSSGRLIHEFGGRHIAKEMRLSKAFLYFFVCL